MPPRFFKHGELPLVLLWLVRERPRHGYDLMAELARLFGPGYRPSPGTIYPAVEALETEGLVAGAPIDGKVVYELTEPGAQALDGRLEQLADLEVRTGVLLRVGDGLPEQVDRLRARLLPLAGRVDARRTAEILDRAADDVEALLHPAPSLTAPSSHARNGHDR
ncbi:MAG: PadR family transcriptional regulator [Solirubrobacteraceae bacterium]|nr:PadR family transcriptional regulator [Solirubrobacteraceae bacterium]